MANHVPRIINITQPAIRIRRIVWKLFAGLLLLSLSVSGAQYPVARIIFQHTNGTLAYWNLTPDGAFKNAKGLGKSPVPALALNKAGILFGTNNHYWIATNAVNDAIIRHPVDVVSNAFLPGTKILSWLDLPMIKGSAVYSQTGSNFYLSYIVNNSFSFRSGGPSEETNVQFVAIDRFNSDIQFDSLVQQSGVYTMICSGTNLTLNPNAPVNSAWRVVGIGDLNTDSNNDILWQNTNGSLAGWLLNGTNYTAVPIRNGYEVSNAWRVIGVQH